MSTHAGAARVAMSLPAEGVVEASSWENEGGPGPASQAIERLDWVGFLARFYPDARRHDYESIAAYIEYQKHHGRT